MFNGIKNRTKLFNMDYKTCCLFNGTKGFYEHYIYK